MTWKQKHKETAKLIALYGEYLFSGEKFAADGYIRLINEIARLDAQKRAIEQMPYGEIDTPAHEYTIEVVSKSKDVRPRVSATLNK